MNVQDVTARIVRSDGAELLLDETNWGLTGVEGAAAPNIELFTADLASGDGSIITGKRVASRDLVLSADVMDTRSNAALRHSAIAFANHRFSFKVYFTYLGCTRWLAADLAAFRCPVVGIAEKQSLSLHFLATAPYWQSMDDFGQDIAAITPRWGFPYMDNPTFGMVVDVVNFARQVVFDYDGDVPAYPAVTITADGDVTNPKLIKDGAFVRLLDTLHAGDTVHLSTDPRRIRIEKNGQNVLHKVDRASNFRAMAMQPGTNTVSYAADHGDNHLHVVLRYNKQYLGV